MKKNDLLLLSSVGLYSFLFYQQSAGINFLLFNCFLVLVLVLKNGIYKNLFNLPWWCAIGGSIFSSICILVYGNMLSVIANILSMSLVAAFSVERNSSILFSGLYALYSYLTAVVFMFIDWAEKQKNKLPEGTKKSFRFFMIVIPFLVSLVFFFLYREANPLFKNFTSNIEFDFITWSWIQFTALGFLLLYGFFYHRPIALLARKDQSAQSTLFPGNFSAEKNTLWGFPVDLSTELTTGILLFSLLNILLLFVNVLDFQYVWRSDSLPEGLNFSEAVHQSIGTLITSIVLAVLIILVSFRGNINFHSSGRTIKVLAYIWILQNAFMLLSTVIRNQVYINEYSLTYKRIGVYIYLLLALIGLFTTLIKIASAKSNWYLFRSNGWLFYAVLILCCVFPWDRIISEFNLNHSKALDRKYLIELSSSNIDQLLAAPSMSLPSKETDTYSLDRLHIKMFNFLKFHQKKEWKSWNLEDDRIHKAILKIQNDTALSTLLLQGNNITSLTPILRFKNIKKLDLMSNSLKDLQELSSFKSLEELSLRNNQLDSIQNIPVLENLTTLDISDNNLREFYSLRNLKKLKSLDLSNNKNETLNSLPVLDELTQLDVSGNRLGHLSVFKRFKNLQILKMNTIGKSQLETFPSLPNLLELEISNMNLAGSDEKAICAISELTGLKRLNISANLFTNLYLIPQELFEVRKNTKGLANVLSRMPASLEYLNVSSNKIRTMDGIETVPSLYSLDISGNELTDIDKIEKCSRLHSLWLSRNKISKISSLGTLTELHSLSLDNNIISDITALKSLSNLSFLDLSHNQLSNIVALSAMKNLLILNLSNNPNLQEIKSLEGMTNLQKLDITNCHIQDLTPLYTLKKLKTLHCYDLEKAKLQELQRRLPGLEIIDYTYHEPASY